VLTRTHLLASAPLDSIVPSAEEPVAPRRSRKVLG
jgi:hypothetical protein